MIIGEFATNETLRPKKHYCLSIAIFLLLGCAGVLIITMSAQKQISQSVSKLTAVKQSIQPFFEIPAEAKDVVYGKISPLLPEGLINLPSVSMDPYASWTATALGEKAKYVSVLSADKRQEDIILLYNALLPSKGFLVLGTEKDISSNSTKFTVARIAESGTQYTVDVSEVDISKSKVIVTVQKI